MNALSFIIVMFLGRLNVSIGFTIDTRHIRILLQYNLQFSFIFRNAVCSTDRGRSLVKFISLLGIILGHSYTQDLCPRLLVIISMSLGLKNVLVASECVSIVHIAKLIDKFVHHTVVLVFIFIYQICTLFDDRIEAKTIR